MPTVDSDHSVKVELTFWIVLLPDNSVWWFVGFAGGIRYVYCCVYVQVRDLSSNIVEYISHACKAAMRCGLRLTVCIHVIFLQYLLLKNSA
jgi:hypothetical protein